MEQVKDKVNKNLLRLVEQFIQHFEDVDGQINDEEKGSEDDNSIKCG